MNNLGLPLEYQEMPEYFDAHNISDETATKNALIEQLLRKYQAHSVLDLTCGTGSQVFFLQKQGYDVVGSDFSPDLLKIARQKAQKDNIELKFIDGDMRTVKIGQFDAAITIFNAIGHVTTSDFQKTLQNISQNLKKDGLYIFDIFNKSAITQNVIADFSMDITKVINGKKIRNIQHSEIDHDKGLLTSYDQYMITDLSKETQKRENRFTLQIYSSQELKEHLKQSGFEVVEQYDMDGSAFVEERSISILTVARKVS